MSAMSAWIDEEKIRFDDIVLHEEEDGEPMTEEEYRRIPRCAWCPDPACPGMAAHLDAGVE
ncbi:MAG: hypothetical protein WKF30_15390 [Pyrinomonadaceae bacterium]